MKAVVFHGIGDIRLDDVPEPKIQDASDAIVEITASAICGTDLHMVRGTMPGMQPGTILGHEGVGIVREIGANVRNFRPGDRVVIPSTIGCGSCAYCRSGYFAQWDEANPNGKLAGTAFFGGPAETGPFDGLQAEYARVPHANVGLVKLPDTVTDDQAILMSDIYPTGYFGADIAEIRDGDVVAVFGCGPVGLFAILSSYQFGAARVIAVDGIPGRLEMAQRLGAEVVNYNEEDPVQVIRDLTGGSGTDRVIDAVGVDSERPKAGPAAGQAQQQAAQFDQQRQQIAPKTNTDGKLWKPGDAPTQAATWAVQACAKAGTLSVIGVYPQTDQFFPIGMAMNKNLTINMGNCNHRKYIPTLVGMVGSGEVDPIAVLTNVEPMTDVLTAYREFDQRKPGWVKVELVPGV